MKGSRRSLALASLGLIMAMLALVPILTQVLGPGPGYLAVFLVYWGAFCVPVAVSFGGAGLRERLSLAIGRAWWVPGIVIVQLAGVWGVSLWLHPSAFRGPVIAVAASAAVVNGVAEELAWRGVAYEGGPLALVGGAAALGAVWMWIAARTGRLGWPLLAQCSRTRPRSRA